jgi:hypothetical protein
MQDNEPRHMLGMAFWRGASARRLRLYGCGCCRVVWDTMTDSLSRQAIVTCELYADGVASESERKRARLHAHAARGRISPRYSPAYWLAQAAYAVTHGDAAVAADGVPDGLLPDSIKAHVVRDIFGNPFRPVTFDPDWRTSTAVALATQMYDSRDFSAMPILADALQDAACDSADILDHCRGPGPYVRGCWVVDLVLGKE